eukprot:6491212-Amphidinium_carterae.3
MGPPTSFKDECFTAIVGAQANMTPLNHAPLVSCFVHFALLLWKSTDLGSTRSVQHTDIAELPCAFSEVILETKYTLQSYVLFGAQIGGLLQTIIGFFVVLVILQCFCLWQRLPRKRKTSRAGIELELTEDELQAARSRARLIRG